MACGDPKAAFRAVILDPRLTLTQPASVTAAAGYDAIAHAVESFVCTKRTARSREIVARGVAAARSATTSACWRRPTISTRAPPCSWARSMRARRSSSRCSARRTRARIPLTARYGTTHGDAIAILLPHVVRWNARRRGSLYAELLRSSQAAAVDVAPVAPSSTALAARLAALAAAGDLPTTLERAGASAMICRARAGGVRTVDRQIQSASVRCRGAPWRFIECALLIGAVAAFAPGRRRLTDDARSLRWPQFRGNPQLTGVSSTALPAALKVMWTFDAGEAIESSAAIADGAVFVGSAAGELIALDFRRAPCGGDTRRPKLASRLPPSPMAWCTSAI